VHSQWIIPNKIRIGVKVSLWIKTAKRIVEITVSYHGNHRPVSEGVHQRLRVEDRASGKSRDCGTSSRRRIRDFIFKHIQRSWEKHRIDPIFLSVGHIVLKIVANMQDICGVYLQVLQNSAVKVSLMFRHPIR